MGVHRIQRVPQGERRRHTSTVTVAITDATTAAVVLDPADVDEWTYRGTGAGGQHRNTSDTAVRVRHRPTGLEAKSEAQRSWWQNRQAAWAELERRVAVQAQATQAQARNAERTGQIGVGDRPSHDWTWCAWRDTATCHATGQQWPMSAAMRGRWL